ncbi:hypothetical protein MRX96_031035 [Rhipicephalus microplus]
MRRQAGRHCKEELPLPAPSSPQPRELSETRASRAAATDRGSQSAPRVALITREPKLARKGNAPREEVQEENRQRGGNCPYTGNRAKASPERQRKQESMQAGGDYCGSARTNSRSNCATSATALSKRRAWHERKAVDTVVVPVKDKYGTQRERLTDSAALAPCPLIALLGF